MFPPHNDRLITIPFEARATIEVSRIQIVTAMNDPQSPSKMTVHLLPEPQTGLPPYQTRSDKSPATIFVTVTPD